MESAHAQVLLALAGLYLGIGLLFAVAFQLRGIGRIDPAAARATWGFRVLVTPGIAALWPILARAWWRAERERA